MEKLYYWNLLYIFVNHDCNERSPEYYMIAIMDTIYKRQYKTLQLMIHVKNKPKDYMASIKESINFQVHCV